MSDATQPLPVPKPAPPKTRLGGEKIKMAIVDEVKEKPKRPFFLSPHLTQRALQNNPRLLELKKELAEQEVSSKKPVKRNPRKK